MDNQKEITLKTIFDVMTEKFDKVENRLDAMDDRLDAMDVRFDGIDTRITNLVEDNREEHQKMFDEFSKINKVLTILETEHNEKIKTLFDAYEFNKDRQTLFSNQQYRFHQQLDDACFRIKNLEKAVFKNNI